PHATRLYTPSLHDALPILISPAQPVRTTIDTPTIAHVRPIPIRLTFETRRYRGRIPRAPTRKKKITCLPHMTSRTFRSSGGTGRDRKSTRLNSSHGSISYA